MTSRRRLTAAQVAKVIMDDESDGQLSDDADDSEDCSDVESDAADAKDSGSIGDNSMNSESEIDNRSSSSDVELSATGSSDDVQSFLAAAAGGYKSRTGRQWSGASSKKKGLSKFV